jgi:hypothetical protein
VGGSVGGVVGSDGTVVGSVGTVVGCVGAVVGSVETAVGSVGGSVGLVGTVVGCVGTAVGWVGSAAPAALGISVSARNIPNANVAITSIIVKQISILFRVLFAALASARRDSPQMGQILLPSFTSFPHLGQFGILFPRTFLCFIYYSIVPCEKAIQHL